MITATIRCDRCQLDLASIERETFRELAYAMGSLIVACHSAIPHTSHGMTYRLEGDLGPNADRMGADLLLECTHEHCGAPRSVVYPDVPVELVGAMTLLFHTAHEGHRLRMTYAGRSWASPAPINPQDDA